MYEPPIQVITEGFLRQLEGDAHRVVEGYGITIDKDELMRALQYDRNQYQKGYEDGQKDALEALRVHVESRVPTLFLSRPGRFEDL